MPHLTPLIGTMVAGLVIAFLFGMAAHRLKLPPIVGYLLAGVIVGPFTPGYVADQKIATELARKDPDKRVRALAADYLRGPRR